MMQPSSATAVLESVRRRWGNGAPPDARLVLDRHPGLLEEKSLVLDLAYEEFCVRSEQGEAPDIDAFCARFPSVFRGSLRGMLIAHQFVEENARLLEAPPAPQWPQPGQCLGDLTLTRELGRGAFARVFLAREASTGDRPVVVKLTADGLHEARTAGRLEHPHIVPILSARHDAESGLGLVCMPYLGEATLEHLLTQAFEGAALPCSAQVIRRTCEPPGIDPDPSIEPASYEQGVFRLLAQLADALAYLHAQGICHRDLKPSNVLLSFTGQAMLLDFNLSVDGQQALDRLGGTLPYMAPEQIRAMGAPSLDRPGAAADVFAFGVIAHELLSGQHPYGPIPTPGSVEGIAHLLLQRHAIGPAPLLRGNPRIDPGVALLLRRCLDVEPSRRPTAAQLVAFLHQHLAPRPGWQQRLERSPRLILGLVTTLLAVAVLGLLPGASAEETDRVREDRARRHYERGRELLKEKRWAGARDQLQAANQLHPEGRTYAALAYGLAHLREHQGALASCQEALAHGHATARLYNLRGYVRMQMYEQPEAAEQRETLFREASTDLGEAIRLDPRLQAARYNRGLLHLRQALSSRDFIIPEEALDDFRQALALGPITPRVAYDAARLFALVSRKRPALRAETLRHLELAVDAGLDPKTVRLDPLFASLRAEDRFSRLVQARKNPALTPPEIRLLDPVDD